jgi:outer membrane immunogenic protein
MFRRILLASAGVTALSGGALAAEPAPVPPPPPPPPLWTGFYVGLNAGGTWSSSSSDNIVTVNVASNAAVAGALQAGQASALATSGIFPLNTGGFIGGGQVGYNYQFATSFVAGIEGDFQGIAGERQSNTLFRVVGLPGFFPFAERGAIFASNNIDYLGTVRGRLGFLVTPTLLLYGTGGFAYGNNESTSSTALFSGLTPVPVFTNVSGFGSGTTRGGWTAGGGVEWMFWPNWSAKVEYLYYHLGSVTYSNGTLASLVTGTTIPAFTNVSATHASFNGNVVRAGVDYHFNLAPPPVVAKY